MSEKRSYKIESFAHSPKYEIMRLQQQVELFWQAELEVYKQRGLMDAKCILECGSGPGFLMMKLLDVLPGCHGTALEIDPVLIREMRKNFAVAGKYRCEILQGSITEVALKDNSFDVVVARLVLEHLPDPCRALKEILRVLKPGGRVFILDNDFAFHLRTYPDIPELDLLYDAYCRSMTDDGGNPMIGRQLPGLLKKAGFADIDLKILGSNSKLIGDEAVIGSESIGISSKLVKDGYLSADILDRIAVLWRELFNHPEHVFFRQIFMCVGEKSISGLVGDIVSDREILLHRPEQPSGYSIKFLKGLDDSDRLNLIVKYMCSELSIILAKNSSLIKSSAGLVEMGLDSLAVVDLKNRIMGGLGTDILVSELFSCPTLHEVAKLISNKIKQAGCQKQSFNTEEPEGETWEEGEI